MRGSSHAGVVPAGCREHLEEEGRAAGEPRCGDRAGHARIHGGERQTLKLHEGAMKVKVPLVPYRNTRPKSSPSALGEVLSWMIYDLNNQLTLKR